MTKYAVVTGASAGIGLATIKRFQHEGYVVVNIARRPCPLPQVINIEADLAVTDLAEHLAAPLEEAIPEEMPDSVILVHNAALLFADAVQTVTTETLRRVMEINVIAPMVLNQLLLPKMNRGSAIIYIGSTLSEKAVPGNLSYVTSKHALVGLMRATCQDLMGQGIHTACICPGTTNTETLRTHTNNDENILDFFRQFNSYHRLIEPSEIADFVYYVAATPVLNGAVVHANLGQKES